MNVLSVGAVQYKAVVCQRWKLWHRVTFNSVNVSRIQDESVPSSLIFVRGCCGPMHRVASSSLPHLLYSSFLWRARGIFKSRGPERFITSDMRTTQTLFGVELGGLGREKKRSFVGAGCVRRHPYHNLLTLRWRTLDCDASGIQGTLIRVVNKG